MSAAIRPLLGSPRRISFLSEILPSGLPFTTVTWDCDGKEQHQKDAEAVRLRLTWKAGNDVKTGKDEGVWDGGNVGTTDMAAVDGESSQCL